MPGEPAWPKVMPAGEGSAAAALEFRDGHHPRVGELAAQLLDLEAISDGLKVAHWVPPS
jgi:hypothetical protein